MKSELKRFTFFHREKRTMRLGVFFVQNEFSLVCFFRPHFQTFLWITWIGLTTVFLRFGRNLSAGWSSGEPGSSLRLRVGLNEWFRLFSLFFGDDFLGGLGTLLVGFAEMEILGVEVECLVVTGFLMVLLVCLHSHSVKNTVLWSRWLSLHFCPAWHSVTFSKMATPRNAVWVSALVFSVTTEELVAAPTAVIAGSLLAGLLLVSLTR